MCTSCDYDSRNMTKHCYRCYTHKNLPGSCQKVTLRNSNFVTPHGCSARFIKKSTSFTAINSHFTTTLPTTATIDYPQRVHKKKMLFLLFLLLATPPLAKLKCHVLNLLPPPLLLLLVIRSKFIKKKMSSLLLLLLSIHPLVRLVCHILNLPLL